MTHNCRKCGAQLIFGENWNESNRKYHNHICNMCYNEYQNERNHKNGRYIKFDENLDCSLYFGVHVAERVLSHIFKDVERMPAHNSGYDFICNHGKMIDVKSACLQHGETKSSHWMFTIRKNHITDFFMCLAFNDRQNLEPQHVWMIPGGDVNDKTGIGISPTTLNKWAQYELTDKLDKVVACCDMMKDNYNRDDISG